MGGGPDFCNDQLSQLPSAFSLPRSSQAALLVNWRPSRFPLNFNSQPWNWSTRQTLFCRSAGWVKRSVGERRRPIGWSAARPLTAVQPGFGAKEAGRCKEESQSAKPCFSFFLASSLLVKTPSSSCSVRADGFHTKSGFDLLLIVFGSCSSFQLGQTQMLSGLIQPEDWLSENALSGVWARWKWPVVAKK